MIRNVEIKDINDLVEIYKYYVENTAISFEYDAIDWTEFKNRIDMITKTHPFLVYEKNGCVIGYAYASPLKGRKAFEHSVETSIYIHRDYRKSGIGKQLYDALEIALKLCNVTHLYACIAYHEIEDYTLNHSSIVFHEKLGYKKVGYFHKCGYKFDRWYDIVWMEKIIDSLDEKKSVISYSNILINK